MMMLDNNLITSKQQARIADLVSAEARKVTLDALDKMDIESRVAQENIITKGGDFQALLTIGFASVVTSVLNKMSGQKHPQAERIEQYFSGVLGYPLDLSGVMFPEKVGFATYMVVPPDLTEDQIFIRITTYFKVNQYAWQSPVADKINRKTEQKRPPGLYIFAHRGGNQPDAEHLGKSYDDAMAISVTFMNSKEYLLSTGFHRFISDHFMDVNGWTRTSSLWSDGRMVDGSFIPAIGSCTWTTAIVIFALPVPVLVSCFWVKFHLTLLTFTLELYFLGSVEKPYMVVCRAFLYQNNTSHVLILYTL